jgi:hypothetical protein
MDSKVKEAIEKATVSVLHHSDEGASLVKGVIVAGHIITVAHIFEREDGFLNHPECALVADRQGEVLGAFDPVFVDHPSDVAVLRASSEVNSRRQAARLRKWMSSARPLTLRTALPPSGAPRDLRGGDKDFSVPCFTVVPGRRPIRTAIFLNPHINRLGSRERFAAFASFKAGMSGAPIVDEAGRLIGLVSSGAPGNKGKMTIGSFPFVYRALPRWFLEGAL